MTIDAANVTILHDKRQSDKQQEEEDRQTERKKDDKCNTVGVSLFAFHVLDSFFF